MRGWFPRDRGRCGANSLPRSGYTPTVVAAIPYAELILTSGSEGQRAKTTEGGTYKWSDDVSYWIREEAYDLVVFPEQVNQIDGDVTPINENPSWQQSVQNGGAITSDGTWVRFNTEGGVTELASALYNHGRRVESWLFQCEVKIEGHSGCTDDDLSHGMFLYNSAKAVIINFYHHTDQAARIVDNSNNVIGSASGGPDLTAGSAFLECVTNIDGDVALFANNEATPFQTVTYTDLINAGGSAYGQVGDNSSSYGSSSVYVRDLKNFRLSLNYGSLIQTIGTEGQEETVTEGGTYVWSDALSYWIRKEAYDLADSDIDQVAQVSGNWVPSGETPAWTEYTQNGGAILVSGSRVLCDTVDNNNESASFSYDHNTDNESWLCQLEVSLYNHTCSSDGSTPHVFYIQTGEKWARVNLYRHADSEARLVDNTNSVLGSVVDTGADPTGGPVFIELIVKRNGYARLFVDSAESHYQTVDWADLEDTAFSNVWFGDLTTSLNVGQQNLYVKDLKVIRLT